MAGSSSSTPRSHWFQREIADVTANKLWFLTGDHPTCDPAELRRTAHANSLFLHLRPRSLPSAVTRFSHTYRLGFLALFFFGIELITGIFLMLYYVPVPENAYASILRIVGEVSFGNFVRDLHRLTGEVMLVTVILHLLRTLVTDSFRGRRAFTWVTGMVLLILTLGLAFSGYLLPWDQRAYWAVTIGTSMAEAAPLVGRLINRLLRGASEIGADGLLRFYLLHVLLLPLGLCVTTGVHYYRIARKHGISMPLKNKTKTGSAAAASVPYLPEILSQELFIGILALMLLTTAAFFFFDAPLTLHADPRKTPLDAQAPWFFLWLQGLLKLGPKTITGILIPLTLMMGLFSLPYLDHAPRRPLIRRPKILCGIIVVFAALPALSIVGTHRVRAHLPPVTRLLQEITPGEEAGRIDSVPYEALPVGIYPLTGPSTGVPRAQASPEFKRLLDRFFKKATALEKAGILPDADAVVLVEAWQANLKRIAIRISWKGEDGQPRKSEQRIIYRHRDGRG